MCQNLSTFLLTFLTSSVSVADLHSTSPKLALLAEQNARLLEQVEQQQVMLREQQQQLHQQHDMQQKVLERLSQSGPQLPADETLQEMNTLLSSTKSECRREGAETWGLFYQGS